MTWLVISISLHAQSKSGKTLAVIDLDTEGILLDQTSVSQLVQIEIEKSKQFKVIDRYDINDQLAKGDLKTSGCYGVQCAVEIGQILKVDYIVTGSVIRFGEKIIFKLRMIDVYQKELHATAVREYYNLPKHIQSMARIVTNDLLHIENDQLLVNQLAILREPIISNVVRVHANGPRMGVGLVTRGSAKHNSRTWLESKDKYPVITQFGYQYETQYLSSGNFQALFEGVFMIGGMDQGLFIPTAMVMNGFRNSKSGLEIAFGPTFTITEDFKSAEETGITILKFHTGWVWAIGKTFQSGNLNIPINLYVSPDKQNGWYYGFSMGFNLAKSQSRY